jgi:hypothetical protein
VINEDGVIYVRDVQPGIASAVDLVSDKGVHLRLVALSHEEAEDAWKVRMDDGEHLFVSSQDFFWDSAAKLKRIWLRTRGARQFAFTLTPPPASPLQASLPLTQTAASADAASFTAMAQPEEREVKLKLERRAGAVPAVKIGPAREGGARGVAEAPADAEFQRSAKWSLTIPGGSMDGISELFLAVRYKGDVARLYSPASLLTDNFYSGQAWTVGLGRFVDLTRPNRLELDILPLRQDAPVYLEAPSRPDFLSGSQIDALEKVELQPEYQLVIDPH